MMKGLRVQVYEWKIGDYPPYHSTLQSTNVFGTLLGTAERQGEEGDWFTVGLYENREGFIVETPVTHLRVVK